MRSLFHLLRRAAGRLGQGCPPAVVFSFLLLAGFSRGATTIDPVLKFAWGENTGWLDLRGDVASGVEVLPTYLRGFAWCENVGWLNFGSAPLDAVSYSQAGGDTGVNMETATGRLHGYAWGENVGWVSFGDSPPNSLVSILPATGEFTGSAWGENIGWINMATGHGVTTGVSPSEVTDWTLLR